MSAILVIAGLLGQVELTDRQIAMYVQSLKNGINFDLFELANQRSSLENAIPISPNPPKVAVTKQDRLEFLKAASEQKRVSAEIRARIADIDLKIAAAKNDPLRLRPFIDWSPQYTQPIGSVGYLLIPDVTVFRVLDHNRAMISPGFSDDHWKGVLKATPEAAIPDGSVLSTIVANLAMTGASPDQLGNFAEMDPQLKWRSDVMFTLIARKRFVCFAVIETETSLVEGQVVKCDGMWEVSGTASVKVESGRINEDPDDRTLMVLRQVDAGRFEEWASNNEPEARRRIHELRARDALRFRRKRR